MALRALASDLSKGLKTLKPTEEELRLLLQSHFLLKKCQEKRSQKTLSKLIGLDGRSIKSGIEKREKILKGKEPSWLGTQQKIRRDEISEETKDLVYDYWKLVARRPTGNKKDLIRRCIGVKTWVQHLKHMLEKTQTEVYMEFTSMHPEIKISQRKFENLMPHFVKGAREWDRQTCICRRHIEI